MVTLVIMDGFGIRKEEYGNAVKLQGTPNLKRLKSEYPYTQIEASGQAVGLTAGQMGNSEVGHLNLGAGRVVFQDLSRINNAIKDKSFFENKVLNESCDFANKNNSTLHLMGLCSNGGVHSHIDHLKALIDLSQTKKCRDVVLHLFLDGRDTYIDSGLGFVQEIAEYIKDKNVKIGSLCGRVYAMDREKRYDRVQKAYEMLTSQGVGNVTYEQAFKESYANKVYDEFFLPTKLIDFEPIKDNDSVIFFNYRTDRAREITESFTVKEFDKFPHNNFKNLHYTCFTEYDATFKNVSIAFPPFKIENNLSRLISDAGLKQLHISETTKYAHVTFFFNGGIETPNVGEERKLIDSYNVLSFESVPQMKAYEITQGVVDAINSKKYDFILVNLSNADMIGHTGNLKSAIKAIGVIDECVQKIVDASLKNNADCLITADHGNAEEMLSNDGEIITSHTTNPVPVILCSNKYKSVKLSPNGKLANIAPTVLKLLDLQVPTYMEQPLF